MDAFGSTCPPNPFRIAERTFSANVCWRRERKRAKSAADRTSAGTASAMAASIVQRPSPESWKNQEKFDKPASSASAAAERSNNHDVMTLPRRQTSAISATLSENRSDSGKPSEAAFFRI